LSPECCSGHPGNLTAGTLSILALNVADLIDTLGRIYGKFLMKSSVQCCNIMAASAKAAAKTVFALGNS
jgi:hypothetical protein